MPSLLSINATPADATPADAATAIATAIATVTVTAISLVSDGESHPLRLVERG